MSADRASKRLTDDEKQAIRNKIINLVTIRKYANKFPFETTQESLVALIRATVPSVILDALTVLRADMHYSRIVDKRDTTRVTVDGIAITIYLHDETDILASNHIGFGSNAAHHITVGNPYYPKILEWATAQDTLNKRAKNVMRMVGQTMKWSSTTGQVARIWPDLVRYLPSDLAERLSGAERASRLPAETPLVEINEMEKDATEFLALMSLLQGQRRGRVYAEVTD
jgi:hypothetical protein